MERIVGLFVREAENREVLDWYREIEGWRRGSAFLFLSRRARAHEGWRKVRLFFLAPSFICFHFPSKSKLSTECLVFLRNDTGMKFRCKFKFTDANSNSQNLLVSESDRVGVLSMTRGWLDTPEANYLMHAPIHI